MNHDLFCFMAKSYALYNRLSELEKAVAVECKRREETLTELEVAKDIAKVVESKRDEVICHEKKILEENKSLQSENAGLWNELQAKKKLREAAEAKLPSEDFKSSVIKDFMATDDYQALLLPVFLQGFEYAKGKYKASFPGLDHSAINPDGDASEKGSQEGEEVHEQEQDVKPSNDLIEKETVSAGDASEAAGTTIIKGSAQD